LVIVVFRWSPAAEVVDFLFVAQRTTRDVTYWLRFGRQPKKSSATVEKVGHPESEMKG
jgi:hypothetical protein